MATRRPLSYALALLLALPAFAYAQDNGEFGAKFFTDLRKLFGELQQRDLDKAFRAARPIRCSDLVSGRGEWKQVAFLNEDRKLGDTHFDNIDDVRRDLARLVFSGQCRSESGSVRLDTSYAITESFNRYIKRQIPLEDVAIRTNPPVTVNFVYTADAYVFELPYVYLVERQGNGGIYTFEPPRATSTPDPNVAQEYRCKAVSDPELTYRFLICKLQLLPRDPVARKRDTRPFGSAAYYILSDGKEAASSVKLRLDDGTELKETPPKVTPIPPVREPDAPPAPPDRPWVPAGSSIRVVEFAGEEFRLNFNLEGWSGRFAKPQFLEAGQFVSAPGANRENCTWKPVATNGIVDDSVLYSMSFKKDARGPSTVVFELENSEGKPIATLECGFPASPTPADITVGRWLTVVGKHVTLEIRPH